MLAAPRRAVRLLRLPSQRVAAVTQQSLLLHSSAARREQPPTEPRNEALEYLERKRQRKANAANQPPSRHALFYRDIIPPFLRVIAWGSSAFFAMHLVWNLLDRDEQRVLVERRHKEYEEQIKQLASRQPALGDGDGAGAGADASRSAGGWLGWLWPFGAKKAESGA